MCVWVYISIYIYILWSYRYYLILYQHQSHHLQLPLAPGQGARAAVRRAAAAPRAPRAAPAAPPDRSGGSSRHRWAAAGPPAAPSEAGPWDGYLVAGWATPLKNMSSSIGMMSYSQYMGKQNWCSKPTSGGFLKLASNIQNHPVFFT